MIAAATRLLIFAGVAVGALRAVVLLSGPRRPQTSREAMTGCQEAMRAGDWAKAAGLAQVASLLSVAENAPRHQQPAVMPLRTAEVTLDAIECRDWPAVRNLHHLVEFAEITHRPRRRKPTLDPSGMMLGVTLGISAAVDQGPLVVFFSTVGFALSFGMMMASSSS